MSPLAALFVRDVRLAIRVGGGGGIGVLFFLIVGQDGALGLAV